MDENSKLNRIILIGNGFDRSLGMPTSYSHFLDWIFQEALKELHSKAMKSYGLLRSSHLHSFENDLLKLEVTTGNLQWIKELIENKKSYSEYLLERNKIKDHPAFHFIFLCKHSFIDELFSFYGQNSWVDIEQVYFERLLETKKESVKDFHLYFELLKKELLKYLQTLEINTNQGHELISKYRKHFLEKFSSIMLLCRFTKKLKKNQHIITL